MGESIAGKETDEHLAQDYPWDLLLNCVEEQCKPSKFNKHQVIAEDGF